jgi:thymidylate kinase
MRKLYILEGPDGVGKTTLANQIHEVWKDEGYISTVVHASAAGNLLQMYSDAERAWTEGYDVVIMDRSPYSELVYGPLLRNQVIGSGQDWARWRAFAERADKFLLMDYPDNLVRRAFTRGEEFVSASQLRQVYLAYCAIDLHSEGFTTWTPQRYPELLNQVQHQAVLGV